ncbi:unnamed protein product [Effrenium voratum]|uniref:Replication protein A subunit n=1 Tax=Effrenium voratum TaxID=2562239 RepID=A0AA36IQR3_9DINO|nr:unnamed protein product [Effrenium voratum]CAJ1453321.1 unnamed protein product [Effrenium voratum]
MVGETLPGGQGALSVGSILQLADGLQPYKTRPTVQVIANKRGPTDPQAVLRISDGQNYMMAIVAADIKDPVEGSIVQLLDWTTGTHEGLPAILVEDWDQSSNERFPIQGQPVAVPMKSSLAGGAPMPACAGDAKSSYPGTSAGDQEEQDQIWRKPATADRPDFLKPSLMTAGGEPVVVPDMKSNPRLLRVDDPEDQIWRKPAALADRPDLLKPSLMTAGGAPVVVPDADEMKGNLGFLHDWHAEGLNPNDSPKPNLLTAGGAPVATDAETRDPRVRAVKSHARAVATPMRRRDAADDPASELGRVRAVATPLRRRDTADDPVADSSPMLPSMLRPAPQAAPLVPIAQLSSFMPRCRVRARVLSKSGIRAFTNARGSSKLFSMDLMDAEGACTRCTCFGSAVDKFFPMIVVKKIYEVNGASVKPGNPRFCRYPMELTLDERGASITALLEDGSIPGIPYKFVSLAQISSAPVGSSCDIMGVVQTLEDPVSVATRSGPRIKRQVILIDSSSASVALNLWAEKAETELAAGSVVFVRHAKISDYSGRTLDLNEGSFLEANPDDPRAFQLQAWYQAGGRDEPVRHALSNSTARGRKRNLAEALQEDTMLHPNALEKRAVNFHRVSPATIVAIRNERAPFYFGCTSEVAGFESRMRQCNKKVENGTCAAGHICPEPAARFNLLLQVADAYATVHCRAFGAEAEMLADVPAAELAVLDDERMAGNIQAEKTYTRIFRNMFRRWSLTLKCRQETFEGRSRVQVTVERCAPVDFVAEGLEMAAAARRALCM